MGTSNAHIDLRKILIDKCKLEGVISMPSGVFKPYAGVSTAVVVFQKGGTTDKVWFYDMEADGFSLDDKRQKIEANDIPDIIEKWETKTESKKSLLAPVDEIKANKYDPSILRYKPIEHIEIEYERPDVMIKKVLNLEKKIIKKSRN